MPLHRVGLSAVQTLIDTAISDLEGGAPPDGDTLNELLGKINRAAIVVNTDAALRALSVTGIQNGQKAMTLGWYFAGDMGGMSATYVASSTASSSSTVRVPDSNPASGRWVYDGQVSVLSARKFGIKADVAYDAGPGLSDLFAALRATEHTEANAVKAAALIEPGQYYADTSVNFTGGGATFSSWNAWVMARGAELIGRCTGKAVIDATATRGLHLEGLHIYGDPSNRPSTAVLLGPRLQEACGNNFVLYVKTEGEFSKACHVNLGSETTAYQGCYWINEWTDPSAYAMIGDGVHNSGLTSDYTTLRSPLTVVSFSRNSHYDCRFAKSGTGESVLLDTAFGHRFRSGYNLSFGPTNFRIRMSASGGVGVGRTSDIEIDLLAESAQSPGVDYVVTLEVPNITTQVNGLKLRLGTPHATDGIIRVVADANNSPLTAGKVSITGIDVDIGSTFNGATPLMFVTDASYNGWDYVQGKIRAPGNILNLGKPAAFYGFVETDDFATLVSVPSSTSGCLIMDKSRDMQFYGDLRLHGDLIANDATRYARRVGAPWANGTAYTWGAVVRGSNSQRLYRCTNAGGTASVIPSHTSGVVTGADGIEWTHLYFNDAAGVINYGLNNTGFEVHHKLLLADLSNPGSFVQITAGAGSPEGLVTAGVGLHISTNGNGASTLYVHPSTAGLAATGWVAK